jgi:hypothetical protein
MTSLIGTKIFIVILSLGMQSYWLITDASMEKKLARQEIIVGKNKLHTLV